MTEQATLSESQCVTLVGIAGAGKSTLAPLLAQRLGWQWMDTDRLLEAYYGRPLDGIYSHLGRDGFLACESGLVERLGASRMVISTGGSVIYSPVAMDRLRLLGPVVWLRIGLQTFLSRVGDASGRGFARRPGQQLAEIFAERTPLYRDGCDLAVDTDQGTPEQCVDRLVAALGRAGQAPSSTPEVLPSSIPNLPKDT